MEQLSQIPRNIGQRRLFTYPKPIFELYSTGNKFEPRELYIAILKYYVYRVIRSARCRSHPRSCCWPWEAWSSGPRPLARRRHTPAAHSRRAHHRRRLHRQLLQVHPSCHAITLRRPAAAGHRRRRRTGWSRSPTPRGSRRCASAARAAAPGASPPSGPTRPPTAR